MANSHLTATVRIDALSDPNLSPQAISLAKAMMAGGRVDRLPFSAPTAKLAIWELGRSGHLGRAV